MSNKLHEELAVVATIDPQNLGNETLVSDWVDMSQYDKVMFVISVGSTDNAIAAKLREALTSGGGTPQDITGKAITALDGADDNKQVILEVDSAELDLADNYRYVACSLTGTDSTNGADVSVVGLAARARFLPATDGDLASVVEIVD